MRDAIHVAMEFLLVFGEANFVEVLKSVKFMALEIKVPYGTSKHVRKLKRLTINHRNWAGFTSKLQVCNRSVANISH